MIALGILLLIAGVVFPLAFLAWLGTRISRPPAPRPRQMGLWLAFNFVLPVGLALWGLRLISARVAAATVIRDAVTATLVAAAILAVGIAAEAAVAHRSRQIGGNRDE
jgi:hypothetical protein